MAKAAAKKVEEVVAEDFEVGQVVVFKGYADPESLPDNSELLEEGGEYEIASINPAKGDNEASYNLKVENPEFNEKKRESATNQKYITVDVFVDEIESAEEAEEVEEAPPAKTARGKATPKVEAKAKGAKAASKAKETEAEADAEELDFAAVAKGDFVNVVTVEGAEVSGLVLKKGPKSLTVEDSESGDAVTIKEDDIESLTEAEEVAAKEPPKEKAKPKAKAKTTAAKSKLKEKASSAKKDTKGKVAKKSEPKEEVDEDLKGMIILTEEEEDEDILKMVEESDVIELAEELAQESSDVDYKLGGILYHVRKDKLFRKIKGGIYDVKGGFAEYVANELKYGYRKAMYLIDIYTKFNKFGLSPESVGEIGWTKAMVIAGAMEEDNAEELLELAKESSASDLKDTIKESYSKKGEDNREVVKKTTFKFRLVESAGAIVQDYLQQAAQQLGFKKLDDAFEAIVTTWASEHLDVTQVRRAGKRGK